MIALADANNFYVSCERAFDPRLEGKAVAVLSNNDGCVISRSPECKAMGIEMGTPHFRLRGREGLVFRSSNYELYGDMSGRIAAVLGTFTPEVERYSIDEAFLHFGGTEPPASSARPAWSPPWPTCTSRNAPRPDAADGTIRDGGRRSCR